MHCTRALLLGWMSTNLVANRCSRLTFLVRPLFTVACMLRGKERKRRNRNFLLLQAHCRCADEISAAFPLVRVREKRIAACQKVCWQFFFAVNNTLSVTLSAPLLNFSLLRSCQPSHRLNVHTHAYTATLTAHLHRVLVPCASSSWVAQYRPYSAAALVIGPNI